MSRIQDVKLEGGMGEVSRNVEEDADWADLKKQVKDEYF